jgi:hypothetical protein
MNNHSDSNHVTNEFRILSARLVVAVGLAALSTTGCSAANGDPISGEGSTAVAANNSEALTVGTYDCSTLTVASFGASSDLYSPTNSGTAHSLTAFVNAAIAQSTQDVAHAGSHDYSQTAHEALAALQDAQTNLASTLTWMTTNGLSGTNASASYSLAGTMNIIIADLARAASLASISAIGNYPTSGVNAASYAELYARKALEIANQAGYHADYCYISPYGREVGNAGTFPSMACSSVP